MKTLPELVAYSKAHPGTLNFAATQGTAAILVAERFKQLSGTDVLIVPYKGGTAAIPDFLGGRIQIYNPTPSTSMALIRDGKMRPLLITSPKRYGDLPDVPTAREVGLPELTLEFWAGMMAPAGTPPEIVGKLNAAINETLRSRRDEGGHGQARLRGQARLAAGFRQLHGRGNPALGRDREEDRREVRVNRA